MECNCGAELKIRQEKLIRFYQCLSCTRVFINDKLFNTPEELKKAKLKYGN